MTACNASLSRGKDGIPQGSVPSYISIYRLYSRGSLGCSHWTWPLEFERACLIPQDKQAQISAILLGNNNSMIRAENKGGWVATSVRCSRTAFVALTFRSWSTRSHRRAAGATTVSCACAKMTNMHARLRPGVYS